MCVEKSLDCDSYDIDAIASNNVWLLDFDKRMQNTKMIAKRLNEINLWICESLNEHVIVNSLKLMKYGMQNIHKHSAIQLDMAESNKIN